MQYVGGVAISAPPIMLLSARVMFWLNRTRASHDEFVRANGGVPPPIWRYYCASQGKVGVT